MLATIELGRVTGRDVITPPIFLLDIEELLEIFGLFMLVIIGIELLETVMYTCLAEGVDHVQVVLAAAMIAIARKVIMLDVNGVSSLTLPGLGAVILALSIGYYLIKVRRQVQAGQI